MLINWPDILYTSSQWQPNSVKKKGRKNIYNKSSFS